MRTRPAAVLVPLLLIGLLPLAVPARAYTVSLTAAEIEAVVRPHFPQRQEGVFGRVTLSDPKVILTPGSERLGLGLSVQADLPGSLVVHAHALVDGEVAYDARRREFHLREPRVVRFDAKGMEEPYTSMVAEAVTAIAQTRMPIIVLYRVPPDAVAAAAPLNLLKGVAVKDGKLQLELGM